MIRHVALLQLQDSATDSQRAAILDALAGLSEQIPTIRAYTFGLDAGVGQGNAHLGIVADFDDLAGFEVYRDHEAHQSVISEHIAPVLTGRTAIQFQVGS